MKSRLPIAALVLPVIVIGLVVTLHGRAIGKAFIDTICNSTTACSGFVNQGTGAGISGNSTGGNGVNGFGLTSGVFGQTQARTAIAAYLEFPFDSSVYSGNVGTVGRDLSGAPADSDHENQNAGVYGYTQYGLAGVLGVVAKSSSSAVAGVLGTNFGAEEEGVFGHDASTSTSSSGLFGSSNTGTGTTTFSEAGEGLNVYSGANVSLEADNATLKSVPALLVQGANTSARIPIVIVRNNYGGSGSANDVFSIGSSGNVIASGKIVGSSSPLSVTRNRSGANYVAYGTRDTTPTIEDVGFGAINGGFAVVRLDPAFASTIDSRAPYAVFLSPEGENNGLYVTAKTMTSFVVREVRGGRSSLPFSYRIVARPLDMPLAQRLPDAQTAITYPVFNDSQVRSQDVERRAMRARLVAAKHRGSL
jgi:hypothetical protein